MSRQVLTGGRIRERRTALGMKQADLARAVGISAPYLNLIEHNKRNIGGKLLIELARVLRVEMSALTEGAEAGLLAGLRDAASSFAEQSAELERIDEFVARFPGWASVLSQSKTRLDRLERSVETLTDRLTHDPMLSTSLHEVLSTVTAIRSTASILVEPEDIDPNWQKRFQANIYEDAIRLAESTQSLVAHLDDMESPDASANNPQEEMDAFLQRSGYHFPALEDGSCTAQAIIAEGETKLSTAARMLIEAHLRRYVSDAAMVPLDMLRDAIDALGLDPSALVQRFQVTVPVILRRIAALPADIIGKDIGLVISDASGALTFRRVATGFPVPFFGAGCPLWPLYQAVARPMTPIVSEVEIASRAKHRFKIYAYAELRYDDGFDGPHSIESTMLILPESQVSLTTEPPHTVGITCRICPKQGCVARREKSIISDS